MASCRPFEVTVTQEKVDRLKRKLELADFPDELDSAGWDYGTSLADVKRFTRHWQETFDWRKAEHEINKLPNFVTTLQIDGFEPVEVHFVHQKSTNEKAIPLLFVHGWPGSFLEVKKILPILKSSEETGGPAFNVVAPSLPNFGFSSIVPKRGFGLKQYAETCHKLMLALGYEQYVTQGGDWGFGITRTMGKLYHSSVKASHMNLVPSLPPKPTSPIAFVTFLVKHMLGMYTDAEKEGLQRSQEMPKTGMGYYNLQTTKPQTIGYSLADSPVGLLGWMYEKLHDWTDEYPWTEDEVCTWVSLYWFSTAGPAASVNIYYESLRGECPAEPGPYNPNVKLGLAYYPKEIFRLPKAWGTTLGPVMYTKEHERGGHFAAWEQPESLAADLKMMFGKGGGAFGVVDGKNGYE